MPYLRPDLRHAGVRTATTRARLEALLILLLDPGDITIAGAPQLQRTLTAEGSTT